MLLARAGRLTEARVAYDRALALPANEPVRAHPVRQRDGLTS